MTDEKNPEPETDPDEPDKDAGVGDQGKPKAPVPFAPDDTDDSPLGDTDQHSDA